MVVVDSLENFAKPAIKRLAKEAGVSRISDDSYPVIREVMGDFIFNLIEKCVVFAQLNKRKTMTRKDIMASLAFMNKGYVLGDEFLKKKPVATTTSTPAATATPAATTATPSSRKVSKKFFLSHSPYERYAQSLLDKICESSPLPTPLYHSRDFYTILHHITIIYTVKFLKAANAIPQKNGRPTLMAKDISLALTIEDALR